jgi:dsDNA-binding SOS-regulon protein
LPQNKFVAEADKYKKETDMSRRLKEWEERIVPVLEEEVCR